MRPISQQNLSFLKGLKTKTAFGGVHSNSKSNPKTARPVSTRDFMHVVLKSNAIAQNPNLGFVKQETYIRKILFKLAGKLGIKIQDVVIMNNHVHLLLKLRNRRSFFAFVSGCSGLIARKILKAERGKPSQTSLLVGRPFSRIVSTTRKSYLAIKKYFDLNRLERLGYSKTNGRKLTALDISKILSSVSWFSI